MWTQGSSWTIKHELSSLRWIPAQKLTQLDSRILSRPQGWIPDIVRPRNEFLLENADSFANSIFDADSYCYGTCSAFYTMGLNFLWSLICPNLWIFSFFLMLGTVNSRLKKVHFSFLKSSIVWFKKVLCSESNNWLSEKNTLEGEFATWDLF